MKKNIIKLMSIQVALCIFIQAQPVYAEQFTNTTEIETGQSLNSEETEEPENQQGSEIVEDPEMPEDEEQSETSEVPEETEQPEEPEVIEEPEKPDTSQKPVPKEIKGLRTTCKSENSVLIEWNKSKGAVRYKVYRKEGKSAYKKIKIVRNTKYVDNTIQYRKSYRYKIIPLNENNKAGKSAAIDLNNQQAVHVTSQKYSYTEMKTDMKELKAQYSNYCEMEEIGESVNGRSIYDFSIGNPKAENSLLVVSTLHGREYICSAVMMKEIQYYLKNYNKSIGGIVPAKALKNMQIHYIVMANPDGVMISQISSSRWKANAKGVDLNRNFPAKKFKVGGVRGAEGYSGTKALSEPETIAVANLTKKLKKKQKLCGVVNYHAMGNIIYGDCSSSKISKDTQKMYQIAKAQTGYKRAVDTGVETPGGQYREYVMYMLNLPSITIEIGSSAAPCPYWQYESEFQKNKLIVLKIADAL